MKKFGIFLLNLLMINSIVAQPSVAFAIRDVICNFWANRSENFDFIIYHSQSEKLNFLLNDILKQNVNSNCKFSYKILKVKENQPKVQIYQSAIFLFDTLQSYHDFHEKAVLLGKYPRKLNFLVHIIDLDSAQIGSKVIEDKRGKAKGKVRKYKFLFPASVLNCCFSFHPRTCCCYSRKVFSYMIKPITHCNL